MVLYQTASSLLLNYTTITNSEMLSSRTLQHPYGDKNEKLSKYHITKTFLALLLNNDCPNRPF